MMEQPDGAVELVTGRRVNLIGDDPGQQTGATAEGGQASLGMETVWS